MTRAPRPTRGARIKAGTLGGVRGFAPAIVVCLAGFALMIGAGVSMAMSPQWNGERPQRPLFVAAVVPVILAPPAAVSFPGEALPTASPGVTLERGGQAT